MKPFKPTLTTTSSPFNLPALRSLGVVGPALRSLGVVGPALRSFSTFEASRPLKPWRKRLAKEVSVGGPVLRSLGVGGLLITSYLLLSPSSIFAQNSIDIRSMFNRGVATGEISYPYIESPINQTQGNALGSIIGSIVGIAIPISAIAVLFYFLWAGFNWLTAGGDKQRVEDARNRMTNAVIGMAIVASALALSYIVNQFFGTNLSIEGASL